MFFREKTGLLSATALTLCLTTGCLTNTYRIPHDSLTTLAQTPPEARGQKVRVVQNLTTNTEPAPAPRVHSNTTIVLVGGVGYEDPYHRHSPPPSSGGGGYGGGGGSRGPSAKNAADDSYVWIVLAVIAAVGLAATEGARYDGWVQIHPMHPVHLYGPGGQHIWVPLAQLTPEQAAWASSAYLRAEEGPWSELGRAPLNRVGLTYSLILGGTQIPSLNGDKEGGFQGHIQLGFFPVQSFGLQLDIANGWRANEMDATVFDGRYSLELDAYPLQAGPFSLGAYGQVGWATRYEDNEFGETDREGGRVFGAGLQGQLELTTRLALTLRGGYADVRGEGTTEFGLGLSIY